MSEIDTRTYELGFLLVPTTPEPEVQNAVEALKSAITAVEGEVLSTSPADYIDLAYQMEKSIGSKKMKYSQGYFGSMKFTAAPEALVALKKTLDADATLIRYILVKTNVENTVVFKKPKVEAKRESAFSDEENGILEGDIEDEDIKEDHELLPDVEDDIAPVAEAEGEEKEEI